MNVDNGKVEAFVGFSTGAGIAAISLSEKPVSLKIGMCIGAIIIAIIVVDIIKGT